MLRGVPGATLTTLNRAAATQYGGVHQFRPVALEFPESRGSARARIVSRPFSGGCATYSTTEPRVFNPLP